MSTADAIVLVFSIALVAGAFSVVTVAILTYQIAKMYAPDPRANRPIPAFGQQPTTRTDAYVDNETPIEKGENKWPVDPEAAARKVAADPVVTHVLGSAEGHLAGERDTWWQEKRDEGLEDEEIAELEAAHVVPVFEAE